MVKKTNELNEETDPRPSDILYIKKISGGVEDLQIAFDRVGVIRLLSTDTKPITNINSGAMVLETDTGESFYWNGSAWVKNYKTDRIEDSSGNQQLGFPNANRMVLGRATAWGHVDTNDSTKFVIASRSSDIRRFELDDSLLDLSGIDVSIDNDKSYAVKDSGGTGRTGMKMGTDDVLDIGDSAITAVRIQSSHLRVDDSKQIQLGNGQDYIINWNGTDAVMDNVSGGGSLKIKHGGTTLIQIDGGGLGFFNTTGQSQQAHIVDADGTLADITTKFNTLLAQMASLGLQATS